jgi:hypothetical protein
VILVPSHSREVLLDVAVGAGATHGRKSDVVVTHGDLCRSISCDVDGCTPTHKQLRSTQAASQALRAPRIFGRCEILILMCPLFAAFVMVAPKFFELCRCHPQPFQGERTPSHHGRWRAARDCEGCHACVQRRGRYRAEEMRAGLLTCTAISPTHIHAFSLSVDFPFLSVEVLEEELAPSTVSPRALCGWTWPQCTSSASRVVCA